MKKLALVLFSAMFLFSCTDDDGKKPADKPEEKPVEQPAPEGKVKFSEVKEERIDAKAFDKWVYYSIDKGQVLEVSDPANSLGWDIAFHRYDVRLNGGKSGKGKGAALKLDAESIDEVTTIPKGKFIEDAMGEVTIAYKTGSPKYDKQPYNQEMRWIIFNPSGNGPMYKRGPKVYMIKTASGRYAKIEFVSYLDDRNNGGLVTWKYAVVQK